ncbi:MAG: FCD domain-containing protein [Planctomycetota bacterium]
MENTNLTEQTVKQIQQMIVSSSLAVGEVFATEADLEKKFNVSRQIVREAVSRLRALGLLESRQGLGLIIGKPDPIGLFEQALDGELLTLVDLKQLAELRYALEFGAIELAGRRATDAQLEKLRQLAEEFAETFAGKSNKKSADEIEFDFHRTILEATGNKMLMRMHNVISAYFVRSAKEINGWDVNKTGEDSAWEHRAIAKALSERNVERARVILSDHLALSLSPKVKYGELQ